MAWTKKAVKKYGWTYGGLDIFIGDVEIFLHKKTCSTRETEVMVYPLKYWIQTGRASLGECKALVEKKPYRIGQILMQGGTVDEAVARIREYISR